MSLPIFKTPDTTLTLLQTNWSSLLDQLLSNPITNGIILNNISLTNAVTGNVINHKLGRKLQGWIVIGKNVASDISDLQHTNSMIDKTLVLVASNACIVNLYVF